MQSHQPEAAASQLFFLLFFDKKGRGLTLRGK
jgi:hypothetical protein